MVDEDLPLIEFTALDRCDRCGSQAYSLARHPDYSALLFCLHHRKTHYEMLLDCGWEVIDDYEGIERLVGAP